MADVAIVGAGLGGHRVAEGLRRGGFTGGIRIFGDEADAPYNRPPLSKDVLTGLAETAAQHFWPHERYEKLGIDLELGVPATGLDVDARRIVVGGNPIPFDHLVLATGATPRELPQLAAGAAPVLTLRTLADATRLREAVLTAEHVAVIGAGFIGSEVAASARKLGKVVSLVEAAPAPMADRLGPDVAAALMSLHRQNGTDLRLATTAERHGDLLHLSDGTVVRPGAIAVGIGVAPNVDWLEDSGLELDNGVRSDRSLVAAPGIYAIGDIANWYNDLFDRRMRVEHWTNASRQAAHVARAILSGTDVPFSESNYAWSDQYGVRIQTTGLTSQVDPEVVIGRLDGDRFVVLYRAEDRIVGAVVVGFPALGVLAAELITARYGWDAAIAELRVAAT